MAKILPDTRTIVKKVVLPAFLGIGMYVAIALSILHKPLYWEAVLTPVLGSLTVGLILLARTRPRLDAALRAGTRALVAAGLVWVIEVWVSGAYIDQEISAATAILPLFAALITWAAAYWWYRRHPLIPAANLREPQH